MNLGGNHLRNAGTIKVLRGVSIAKNLKKIYLNDNQFMEEEEVLQAIQDCMIKNKELGRYDFRFNFISDYGKLAFIILFVLGVERITDILSQANHVYDVEIPERISKECLEAFRAKLGENKPKKGKKGKGKKKKK